MKLNIFIEKIKVKYAELEHKHWSWRPFYNGALEAFSILQAPKYEVVSEWEDRTGDYYSQSAPVYIYYENGSWDYMRFRKAINLQYMNDRIFVAKENITPGEKHE